MLIAQQHPDDPLSISQNDMALRKTLITEVLQAAFYLSMAVVLSVCETFSTSFGWERVRAPINNLVKSEAAVKLLAAIIQPHKLDEVRKALSAIGVRGIAVSEVRGFGR